VLVSDSATGDNPASAAILGGAQTHILKLRLSAHDDDGALGGPGSNEDTVILVLEDYGDSTIQATPLSVADFEEV